MSNDTTPAAVRGSDSSAGLRLPAPRLQLRWELAKPEHKRHHNFKWACHYELVLPLDPFDVRREVYDDAGEVCGERSELVAPLKPPSLRGSDREPCRSMDGSQFCDPPFRDGAHAKWDSALLGRLPIYVIAPDGTAFLDEA